MRRVFLLLTMIISVIGLRGQTGVECPIFATAHLLNTDICADGTTAGLRVDVGTTSTGTMTDYTIEITGAETIASVETSDVNGDVSKVYQVSTDGIYSVSVISNRDWCTATANFVELNVQELPSSPIITVSPSRASFCEGDVYSLIASSTVSSGTVNYVWSGDGSSTTPTQTGITTAGNHSYSVTATANGCSVVVLGGEIAIDGTFDAFDKNNVRFNTTYTYPTTSDWANFPSGYWVDDEVYAYHGAFCTSNSNLTKRTDPLTGEVSDRGNFMLFDAANPVTEVLNSANLGRAHPMWRLVNQPVKPNTTYNFSVDALTWPSGIINMMLLVAGNNDSQAEPIDLTISGSGSITAAGKVALVTGNCHWSIISGTWYSGSNTTVTFMVSEVGNSHIGHEGAIDNVSFSTGLEQETVSQEIIVEQSVNVNIASDKYFVIDNEEVLLTATIQGAVSNEITWVNTNTDVVVAEAIENELSMTITEDVVLQASVQNNAVCGGAYVLSNEISVQIQDLKVVVQANKEEAVIDETLTLIATVVGAVGELTYEWISQSSGQRVKKADFPDAAEITFTQTGIDDYYVKVTDEKTGVIIKSDWVFASLVVAGVNSSNHLQKDMVYPTTVKDVFTINNTGEYEVSIYDFSGVLVQNEQLVNKSEVAVDQLKNGVYLVKISQGGELSTTKIIVNR